MRVRLSTFDNASFERGRSRLVEFAWMLISALAFRHSLGVWAGLKVAILRAFGAQVGTGVMIKPSVQIKFPWKLVIGNDVWIGEHVWIDNLDMVTIGSDVCISQGAMLLCGSHDYSRETFDLITRPIVVEDGAWICAKAVVCPGVRVGRNAVLTAGSLATADIDASGIYQGNPASLKRARTVLNTATKGP
jgi:putative colanic acid biosynthesis acetyltransferase WcaF